MEFDYKKIQKNDEPNKYYGFSKLQFFFFRFLRPIYKVFFESKKF